MCSRRCFWDDGQITHLVCVRLNICSITFLGGSGSGFLFFVLPSSFPVIMSILHVQFPQGKRKHQKTSYDSSTGWAALRCVILRALTFAIPSHLIRDGSGPIGRGSCSCMLFEYMQCTILASIITKHSLKHSTFHFIMRGDLGTQEQVLVFFQDAFVCRRF